MEPLTRKQRAVLDFLIEYRRVHRIAPTLTEIAEHCGVTKETAHAHLGQLQRKGYLRRVRNEPRGIYLVDPEEGGDEPGIEMVGFVTAGAPIEPIVNSERLDFQRLFGRSDRHFALRVKGDSMVDAGIHEGDFVLVQRQETAEDGQLVIALIDGEETTLKRFYREKSAVRLQPANPRMNPIFVTECRIQGVVVGLIRRY